MTKHIAIYIRVSGKRQDLRSQKPDVEKWIAAMADGVPVKWYTDKASGKSFERPGWQKLERANENGEVLKLVVWRLDRLGRLTSGLVLLFERLQKLKIDLVSIRDGFNLDTPAGRLTAHILASISVFENETRSERILAGQQAARTAGKTIGGSKAGRRVTVTVEAEATVRKLHADGVGVTAIARAVSLSRPTIYRLLGSS